MRIPVPVKKLAIPTQEDNLWRGVGSVKTVRN